MGSLAEHQGHQAPLMAEAAGVNCPSTRYEEACASAGVAVRESRPDRRRGRRRRGVGRRDGAHDKPPNRRGDRGLAIAADDLFEVRAG